jgi:DNA repair protein RecO (recombination protein O)
MEKKVLPLTLVKFIYEFKTLVINGEYPNVYSCQVCGEKENLHAFSMKHRGLVCDKCREKEGGDTLQSSSIYTMQYIISTPIEKLYSFKLSDEVQEELVQLMRIYRKRYFTHVFKSEEFLEKSMW